MATANNAIDRQKIAESLRSRGYRPIRFRPYAAEGHGAAVREGSQHETTAQQDIFAEPPQGVLVAAAWTRDGRDWQLAHSLTADKIQQHDQQMRQDGYLAVDVAGYIATQREQHVEDFDFLIGKVSTLANLYQYRAVVHARAGKAEEAKNDLAKFTELNKSASSRAYLEAVVAAYLGEDAGGA